MPIIKEPILDLIDNTEKIFKFHQKTNNYDILQAVLGMNISDPTKTGHIYYFQKSEDEIFYYVIVYKIENFYEIYFLDFIDDFYQDYIKNFLLEFEAKKYVIYLPIIITNQDNSLLNGQEYIKKNTQLLNNFSDVTYNFFGINNVTKSGIFFGREFFVIECFKTGAEKLRNVSKLIMEKLRDYYNLFAKSFTKYYFTKNEIIYYSLLIYSKCQNNKVIKTNLLKKSITEILDFFEKSNYSFDYNQNDNVHTTIQKILQFIEDKKIMMKKINIDYICDSDSHCVSYLFNFLKETEKNIRNESSSEKFSKILFCLDYVYVVNLRKDFVHLLKKFSSEQIYDIIYKKFETIQKLEEKSEESVDELAETKKENFLYYIDSSEYEKEVFKNKFVFYCTFMYKIKTLNFAEIKKELNIDPEKINEEDSKKFVFNIKAYTYSNLYKSGLTMFL